MKCLIGLVMALAIGGCATGRPASALLTSKPVIRKQPVAWQLIDATVSSQIKLPGHLQPSVNLADGTVPDSSFFVNRRISELSPEQVRLGPTEPDHRPRPPFAITRLKDEGKTAGFFVKDAKGDRYLFKLDVIGQPELITGAEVVASKLLYALGYYVPSYEIEGIEVSDLHVAEGRQIDPEDIQRIVSARAKEGRVRVSATRLLEGEILGPFRFKTYRDFTELRALRLAYAWLNNTDAKDHNTLMVWDGAQAIGYLIDFGSSLGADAERGSKLPCQGWTNDVDPKVWMAEALTLSLYDSGCKVGEQPFSAAVGLFSSRFDPQRWKPYVPNLAFEAMTPDDAAWMVDRLAQLSSDQVAAAVDAGAYHRREDARQILDVLEARRQLIVSQYGMQPGGINP